MLRPLMTLRTLRMTYRLIPQDEDSGTQFVNFEFGFGRVHIRVNGVPYAEIGNVDIDSFTETCSSWLSDNYDDLIMLDN